jgi:formylglycine-generating enzyme required for sulfatase activity
MQPHFFEFVRSLGTLGLALWVPGSGALAQTPAGLSIQTYAGLTITGAVGTVYSVEYVTDLAQTNSANAWHCLESLQLPASPYLWADKSAPTTGKRFYRAVVFAPPTNMVFIPPGSFRMGSPTDEVDRYSSESPQTAVTISRGLSMGKSEVTQGEYQAVTGDNPSAFTGNSNLPVETVSWGDATNYCAALTQRERAAGRISVNWVYRLPTEAEWEYACRGWTSTRFSYGDAPEYANLTNYAWYSDNAGATTHPVGQKLPNPWGLYDMHGNVGEWCLDWNSASLPGGIALDPQGPALGSSRQWRGGHWAFPARRCRSAFRSYTSPDSRLNTIGFRVVLAPGQDSGPIEFASISGETGYVLVEASRLNSSIHTNQLDFGAGPSNAYLSLLTQRAEQVTGGQGGSSAFYAQGVSYEVLNRAEGAMLLKAGPDILYTNPSGEKTDYLVSVGGTRLGVSVGRAVSYPPDTPYTLQQAQSLLTSKLQNIQLSSQNVQETDRWVKQILHVVAQSPEHVTVLQEAAQLIDFATKGNTIVYITRTDGGDSFIYY